MKTIAIISGGMDSATMAYYLLNGEYDLDLVSFNYGQRHVKELDYAIRLAKKLGLRHDVIDLTPVGQHLTGSALTDAIEVPEGHYAAENMKVTVVPNRNAIMLSVAFGIAVAREARYVAAAFHAGDHFIYPDCRPRFVKAFDLMEDIATDGFGKVSLITPFINMTKSDIAWHGNVLGVPYELTWSCYKGEQNHCGKCGTCIERIEAFALAGVTDPTAYDASNLTLAPVE